MTPWIYLSSQSPRRQSLLTQIGQKFELLWPDEDEDVEALEAIHQGESPKQYVLRVTRLKLSAALNRLHQRGLKPAPILCADTTVALGHEILGKPRDRNHARHMLHALRGQSHEVMTAVSMGTADEERHALSISRVQFGQWPDDAIERYLDHGEWEGKAGAYAIQGLAAADIAHIDGSHSGIMGLPLYETAQLLRKPWKGVT
jgi:septum formation protein